MSKLSAKQRAALPLSSFGQPQTRSFPILDKNDVKDAAHLVGHAKNPARTKARIVEIAKRKGLASALPEAWKTKK